MFKHNKKDYVYDVVMIEFVVQQKLSCKFHLFIKLSINFLHSTISNFRNFLMPFMLTLGNELIMEMFRYAVHNKNIENILEIAIVYRKLKIASTGIQHFLHQRRNRCNTSPVSN